MISHPSGVLFFIDPRTRGGASLAPGYLLTAPLGRIHFPQQRF